MSPVYRPVEVIRMAQRVRHAREALSDVTSQLVELGVDSELLRQLTNVECELEEVYLELVQTVSKCPPRPQRRRPMPAAQLPL